MLLYNVLTSHQPAVWHMLIPSNVALWVGVMGTTGSPDWGRGVCAFRKALATILKEQVPGNEGCLHLPCCPVPIGCCVPILRGGFDHQNLPSPPGS